MSSRRAKLTALYISTKEVAKILGWDTLRARRWLKKEGAAIRVGRRYFTTRGRLRAAFPELLSELPLK